ncbi:MAG: hypothetical protein HZC40_17630 [Chloroflexi bacterium]|nr:hypothetical protein [Chloroflexota bacterium]
MSSKHVIPILGAIIGAAGVIIAALITGIFALLVEQTKSNANATSVWTTVVAQRTADVPVAQATYTRLPTQQPYTAIPTSKPNVTVVTPKPITIVATPDSSQQNPPPGSILQVGQNYSKDGIVVGLKKSLDLYGSSFAPCMIISNQSGQQLIIRWRNSYIHAKDDKNKIYSPENQNASDWDTVQQASLSDGDKYETNPYQPWSFHKGLFRGPIDATAKYIIISIDQLAGMSNMSWRFDLK